MEESLALELVLEDPDTSSFFFSSLSISRAVIVLEVDELLDRGSIRSGFLHILSESLLLQEWVELTLVALLHFVLAVAWKLAKIHFPPRWYVGSGALLLIFFILVHTVSH